MFPSPSTSTPFSVKDILNLEQNPDVMVSSLDISPRMDCSATSSCMLARLKQEPLRDMPRAAAASSSSLTQQDIQDSNKAGRGNFAPTFYGKSYTGMEMERGAKSDAFEEKRRKGEHKIAGLRAKCRALYFEEVSVE